MPPDSALAGCDEFEVGTAIRWRNSVWNGDSRSSPAMTMGEPLTGYFTAHGWRIATLPSWASCIPYCNTGIHTVRLPLLAELSDSRMMFAKTRSLPTYPSFLGDAGKIPRLPSRPTTRREPRLRLTPLASESDPYPVCHKLSAATYEHRDSTRKRAPRGGDYFAPRCTCGEGR